VLLTIGKTSYTVTVVAPPGVRGDPPPLLEIRPSSDPQPRSSSSDAVGAGSLLRADVSDLTPANDCCAPRCHSHSSTDSDGSLESDRQPGRRGNGADAVAAELTLQSANREFSARCALTRYDAIFVHLLVPAKYGWHLGPGVITTRRDIAPCAQLINDVTARAWVHAHRRDIECFETLAVCVSARLPVIVAKLQRRQARAAGMATTQRRSLGDMVLGALLRRSAFTMCAVSSAGPQACILLCDQLSLIL